MEDTELQDELLTKPLEWSYNPIYPKKAMNSKIEKQASFEMIYPDDEGRDELDTNPFSKST
jgi:hypothetical protein